MLYSATLVPLEDGKARDLALPEERVLRWLRADCQDNDAIQDAVELIEAAMSWAESYCQQALFAATYTVNLTSFCGGRFPQFLNVVVTGVTYAGADNVPVTLDSALYTLTGNGLTFAPGVLLPVSNPTAVTITFTAGYTADRLPGAISQALRLTIADWYDRRSDGKRAAPSAAENLLQPFKLYSV